MPALLLSDNAKTFKAACKEIRRLCHAEELWRYLADKRISWRFIVEKALWWGGFWERLVRSIKRPLKKVIGRTSLSFDELQTLVVEIECLLNARPITYVYDDTEAISFPLTPSHLIYGRRITASPNTQHYEVVSTHKSLTKRLRHHKQLLERFAKQWRDEYLLSLRENSHPKQRNNRKSNIAVGDIVIVKNERSNRNFWKLAKVVELHAADDGVVRAATIRIFRENSSYSQLLHRSVKHLIPIDVQPPANEEKAAEQGEKEEQILPQSTRLQRDAAITGQLRRLKQLGVV